MRSRLSISDGTTSKDNIVHALVPPNQAGCGLVGTQREQKRLKHPDQTRNGNMHEQVFELFPHRPPSFFLSPFQCTRSFLLYPSRRIL